MGTKARKAAIWFFSLSVIFCAYFLIMSLSDREPIKPEEPTTPGMYISDINASETIATISNLDIKGTEGASFKQRDGEVIRELGYDHMLRSIGDLWRLDMPYITITSPDYVVKVTADEALIELEEFGSTQKDSDVFSKDMIFNGHVKVHFDPNDQNERDIFVWLDDLHFYSLESMGKTTGPMHMIAGQDVNLLGTGMEFVYRSGDDSRFEYMKIDDLEYLKVKLYEDANDTDPNATVVAKTTDKPDETTIQDANQLAYQMQYTGNVQITGPNTLILTDVLLIKNILTDNAASEDSNDITTADSSQAGQTDAIEDSNNAGNMTAKDPNIPFREIVITCDEGMMVYAEDVNITKPTVPTQNLAKDKSLRNYEQPGMTVTLSREINYDVVTKAVNLKGNSRVVLMEQMLEHVNRYRLNSDEIILTVADEAETASNDAFSQLRDFRAFGGIVKISNESIKDGKYLGFKKLACDEFIYLSSSRSFEVRGTDPNIIMDNSKIAVDPQKTAGNQDKQKFSLRSPCYAVIDSFSEFKYFLDTDEFTMKPGKGQIDIDYFPVANGKVQDWIVITAGSIKAKLQDQGADQKDLLYLHAMDGVIYDDKDENAGGGAGKVSLMGSDLEFERDLSTIHVWGNEQWPCKFNGVTVPGIKYDIKEERFENTEILGPGILW